MMLPFELSDRLPPLLMDGLDLLAGPIARELHADHLSRQELIDLVHFSWHRLEPSAGYEIFQPHPGEAPPVVEALCGHAAPPGEGWLTWLAQLLACLVLLWETERHSHPLRLFGREWPLSRWL